MTAHRAWDWDKSEDGRWLVASEESHYLADRWKAAGYRDFLDLGCGLGRHSLAFARSGFAVKAFDLSPRAVESTVARAASEGLEVEARVGDMSALPYADASFDCLLAYHVITHTDTPGVRAAIAEAGRVLRPGGELYVTLGSKRAWGWVQAGFERIDENTVLKVEEGPEDGVPHFFADDESAVELFRDFSIVSLRHSQDLFIEGRRYDSWHYYVLGSKP